MKKILKLSLGTAVTLASSIALAQESSESLTTVVVTGSRIARPDLDRLQPTTVIGAEQIESRALTNVIDALNEIPAFGPPTASAVGAQGSSFGVAQSFADFFSLGSQRTLTLVNGNRFVSSNTSSIFGPDNAGQQVDLNSIPTKLIERVEVIAVGGAPVYGADAIAGTVNIILKKDFEGFDVDATVGQTERGDASNYRLRALAGTNFADGRGNVAANIEYSHSQGLVSTDRDRSRSGLFFTAPADPDSPFDQVLIRDRRIGLVNTGGIPLIDDFIPQFVGVLDDAGNVLAFDPNGNLVPYNVGMDTGSLVNNIGGDGLNLAPLTTLLAPNERATFTTIANFKLTDKVRLVGEAWYSNSRGTRLRDQPIFNTALFGSAGDPDGNLIVSTDNPFLSPAARTTIRQNLLDNGLDPSTFLLARANTDISTGIAKGETNLYRFVAGVEGELDLFGKSYEWEIKGNYGRSRSDSREPQVVQQNFLNAIDAVRDPATGQIVCRSGVQSAPVRTGSNTCAPLNLFGLGAPSQAARDYITTQANQVSTLSQRVFTADISGPLFELPGGALQAAIGYENRRETSKFEPDDFFQQGLGRLVAIGPLSGDFDTDEVFGELLIPIIGKEQGIPGIHSLQFEGAIRYVDHSIAGGDTTHTAGLRYAPIEDVQFRGNRTTAIRSPSVQEAFNPTSQAFATATDPCDSRFIDAGPNPAARAANCAAAGITQPFTSNIVDATAQISVAGNPNAKNEEADSESVGVVFRPRWIPKLTMTVDWIRIDLKDAIVSLTATDVLAACFDSPAGIGSTALCGNIDRDPTGQVSFVRTGVANAGSLKFKGVNAQIDYGFDLGAFGQLNAGINYFNLHELTQRVGLGDVDRQAGEIGTSKNQGVINLNYRKDDFSGLLQAQFIGKAKFDVDEPENTRDISGVDNWWLFNATAGYQFTDQLSARFVVDNLFDRDPPFPSPGGGGTITYFKGLLGRNFTLQLNMNF